MQINDKYKIESDSLNITLYRHEHAKSGNEYWRPVAYFGTMAGALHHLVNLEVAGTGLKDLQTVVNKQTELHRLIDSLAASLKQPAVCCGV